MVREEILDNGTRRYVLTSGPGIPEHEVSEERYLGWVMFRARRLESIADPALRARCARHQAALGRSTTTSPRLTTGQSTGRASRPREPYARGDVPIAQLVRAAGRYAFQRANQAWGLPFGARPIPARPFAGPARFAVTSEQPVAGGTYLHPVAVMVEMGAWSRATSCNAQSSKATIAEVEALVRGAGARVER